MATPHVSSVISLTIQDHDATLYDKLIQMETYTYDSSTQFKDANEVDYAGVAEYQPFWQKISDGFATYFQYYKREINRQAIQEFIIALYGFLFYFEVYGYGDQSKKDESHASIVLQETDLDTLITTIKGYAVSYYDDYQYTTDSAPNLEADTDSVYSGSRIHTLKTYYSSIAQDHATQAIFGNSPEPQGNYDPQIAWDLIFDTLGWQAALEASDIDYTVPPRPESLT